MSAHARFLTVAAFVAVFGLGMPGHSLTQLVATVCLLAAAVTLIEVREHLIRRRRNRRDAVIVKLSVDSSQFVSQMRKAQRATDALAHRRAS